MTEVSVRWRWRGGRLHKLQSERQNNGEQRFKPHRLEADWPKEGEQEVDQTRVKMTVLKLTEDTEHPEKLITDVTY